MNWAERALLGLAVWHCGCSGGDRWGKVDSFACQLQELNVEAAAASPFDLLVMDFSRDGSWSGRYSEADLARLHQGGRLLVVYLSVGEAENYRDYWKKSWRPGQPAWLGPTNPEWGGNYKVRYWDPGWRSVLFEYTEKVVALGYDGVFLDVVDAHEYWQSQRPTARAEMISLVKDLAAHLRRNRPIGVFLNGGEALLEDPELLKTITGLAKEEVFFGLGGDGKPTPPDFTRQAQGQLKKAVDARRLVLSIDYTSDNAQASAAHRQARQAGYLEYVGVRALDKLVEQPR